MISIQPTLIRLHHPAVCDVSYNARCCCLCRIWLSVLVTVDFPFCTNTEFIMLQIVPCTRAHREREEVIVRVRTCRTYIPEMPRSYFISLWFFYAESFLCCWWRESEEWRRVRRVREWWWWWLLVGILCVWNVRAFKPLPISFARFFRWFVGRKIFASFSITNSSHASCLIILATFCT